MLALKTFRTRSYVDLGQYELSSTNEIDVNRLSGIKKEVYQKLSCLWVVSDIATQPILLECQLASVLDTV